MLCECSKIAFVSFSGAGPPVTQLYLEPRERGAIAHVSSDYAATRLPCKMRQSANNFTDTFTSEAMARKSYVESSTQGAESL